MEINRIKDQYSAIYVTVVSILLGLALEDLISLFRQLENPGIFVWLSTIFIAHIIINAWIAYSSAAISVRLVPIPLDAINVFILTIAHFALNTFVGKAPYQFFFAVSVYSLIAGLATFYNVNRAEQDSSSAIKVKQFRPVILINIIASIAFAFFGWLSAYDFVIHNIELVFMVCTIPFATIWLLVFWRIWKSFLKIESSAD